MEQSRVIFSEREKELLKLKEQKDSELQTAKTLYEEAHQWLSQATKTLVWWLRTSTRGMEEAIIGISFS